MLKKLKNSGFTGKLYDSGNYTSYSGRAWPESKYFDLYELGLMSSKAKREKLCKKLNISYCNGKQLLKRINMFGITIEEIREYDC